MNKYIFINNKLTSTPYCHANYIQHNCGDYDITVRLIILDKERLIYIRINNFDKLYYGLEARQIQYKFDQNLKTCEAYLERNYKKYKIYNSYNINELQYQLQKDILNS